MALALAVSLLFAAAAAAAAKSGSALPFRQTGRASLPHASFVSVLPDSHGAPVLWTTAFQALGAGKVYHAQGSANASQLAFTAVPTGSDLTWPNIVSYLPPGTPGLAGGDEVLFVPDGFLPPGHNNGGIYAVLKPLTSRGAPQVVALTAKAPGFFHHMVDLRDLNGDGLLDVLTARVKLPLTGGSATGELLWLEQPKQADPFAVDVTPWREHVLVSGPDVVFAVADDLVPGLLLVYAAQFFTTPGLVLYAFNASTLAPAAPPRMLDGSSGPFEAVYFADLDADGVPELVASTHVGRGGGCLYAYTVPTSNVLHGAYTRTVLAGPFPVTEKGAEQASPGFSVVVHPDLRATTGRPTILLAGDGSQQAYVLTPVSETGPLAYNVTVVIKVAGVIGSIAAGDLDGDGFTDFFVPDYDQGLVYSFSFYDNDGDKTAA
jgi:hypothetical protein